MNAEFWECIESFAELFDDNPAAVEARMEGYITSLKTMPLARRESLHRKLDANITALQRLSVRMIN